MIMDGMIVDARGGEGDQPQQLNQEIIEEEIIEDGEDQIIILEYNPPSSRSKPTGRRTRSTKAILKASQTTTRKRQSSGACKKANSPVMVRAEEIQAKLDSKYPSFAMIMRHSYVVHGFLMVIPKLFCKKNMPQHKDHEEMYVLENEAGKVYKAKFIVDRMALSSGWRRFALENKLMEGDACVFHLIGKKKFKVYIVRSTSLGVDGTPKLSLLKKENNGNQCSRNGEGSKGKDTRGYEKAAVFVAFQDFNIVVNGCIVDLNTPDTLFKYYELCKSQNSYLHDGILEPVSPALATAMISDTVRIVDEIRTSTISTPKSTFAIWDQALEGFVKLGLEVGFLRARVSKLVGLAAQAEETPHAKRLKQATVEYNLKGEDMKTASVEYNLKKKELRCLETVLQKAKQDRVELFVEIQTLNGLIEMDDPRFLEEAKAPW